jgi:hypothetical protein
MFNKLPFNFIYDRVFKFTSSFLLAFLFCNEINAQKIVNSFNKDSITHVEISDLKSTFGTNKTIIKDFETQTLIALSYFPELKDNKIKFRLKNRTTPLATRPTFFSLCRSAKKRTYVVTISKQSNAEVDTITLKNLSFNAQIGVIGHELSYVSDYLNRGFLKLNCIGLDIIFSKKRIDTLEFNTDMSCINHGLGFQLLDWSINVRENLNRPNWLGAVNLNADIKSERYMNPKTIINILETHPLYEGNSKLTKYSDD